MATLPSNDLLLILLYFKTEKQLEKEFLDKLRTLLNMTGRFFYLSTTRILVNSALYWAVQAKLSLNVVHIELLNPIWVTQSKAAI